MAAKLSPILLTPCGPIAGSGGTPNPSYNVSGPSTGVALAASTNFTITGANLTGPVIITMASDDPGGVFTPSTRTIDVGSEVQTFTYTPDGSLGIHNLSWTNNGGLANPGGIAYEVTAIPASPSYTLEAPSPASGDIEVESGNFTVTGSNLTGDVIVTPASTDAGDTFNPVTVTLTIASPVKTFKMTPDATTGARDVSTTNDSGLSNPAAVAYTANGTDPAYLAGFRTYAAGDIPPGLLPEQYDGIAYLYEPHPQAMVFQ